MAFAPVDLLLAQVAVQHSARLALVVTGLSIAIAFWVRAAPRGLTWSLFAGAVSLTIATWALPLQAYTATALELTAWICAALSVLWGFAVNLAAPSGGGREDQRTHRGTFTAVANIATLATGLGAGIIVLTILSMRAVDFSVALLGGGRGAIAAGYGFHAGGIVILGLLLLSSILAWVRTRHGALITVLHWLGVASVTWACLLPSEAPAFFGQRFHTTVTLKLAASLAAVLAAAAWLEGSLSPRCRATRQGFDSADLQRVLPGLRTSCGAVALGILLLCCYHLVVPLEMGGHSDRLTAAFVALIALSGGGSLFVLTRRRFSVNLAEVAMALASVGACAIAVMAVPSRPALMVHRFPMIFNAMVVGLAVAAWVWSCLALSWGRQLEVGASHDKAMKKRMVHCAERFSFTTACMGLLIASLMAIWPRLPRIAAMDDSFGRFAAGISGNLLLLWVALWCARRLSRVTFHLLAILVLISTAGFVAVRVAPFTPAG